MGFHIATPLALALLVLIPFFWWEARRSFADLTPARARALLIVRAAVAVLLAVALASIVFNWQKSDLPVSAAFCVDVSGSMNDAARAEAGKFIAAAVQAKAEKDRAGIIAFDGAASLVEPVAAGSKAVQIDRLSAPDRTHLAEAIRLASLSLPADSDRRIVLVTDGRQTEGDARAAAAEARSLGIRIDTLAPPAAPEIDVAVAALDAPAFVLRAQPFDVSVKLASAAKTRASVKLFVDGQAAPAQQQDVALTGAETVVVFPVELDAEGRHVVKVTAETPGDAVARNNSAAALVSVGPKPSVLVVASDKEDAQYLAQALATHQFQIAFALPSELPNYKPDAAPAEKRAAMMSLLRYDVVLLSNVNAKDFTREQMLLLNAYVYDLGGGLVMVGGKDSFGTGGWYKTPVEAALPVYTDPLKESPVFALVLILDKSWSMGDPQKGDISKIDVAKEAVIAAMEKLTRKDYLSVITFDTEVHTILAMQRAENLPALAGEVSKRASFGLTNFYPALIEAEKLLKGTVADYKHTVLISDGRPSGSGKDYQGQLEKMVKEKIVVSTVAVGVDADKKLLNEIAAWGKGQYYFTDKVEVLPEVVLKEAGRIKELLLVEGDFAPRPGPNPWSPILKGLDIATMPPVLGFNRSRAKETAQVEIIVSAKDEPLLASWRYGAGAAVAFTSDAKNVWCPQWVGPWEQGFSRFWRQVVLGALQIRRGETDYRLSLARGPEKTMLTLDAVDRLGRFAPGRSPAADVYSLTPEGAVAEKPAALELRADAPGRYSASLAVDASTALLVEVKDADGHEVFTGGGPALAPAEYLSVGTDDAMLGDLRGKTGLRLANAADVFAPEKILLPQTTAFDALLLTLATILFAVDVLIRRLPALVNLFARGRGPAA